MNEDALDKLPKRMAMHRHRLTGKECHCSWCRDKYEGKSVPYRRIRRWLISKEGLRFDDVVSEFVRLPWVPYRYRTCRFLHKLVETNTFKTKTGISFYSSCWSVEAKQDVNNCWREVFYAHPESGVLCFKPRNSRIHYSNKQKKEMSKWFIKLDKYDQLIKLDGIWYRVRLKEDYESETPPAWQYDPNKPLLYDKKAFKTNFISAYDQRWIEYQKYCPSSHKIIKQQLSHEDLKKFNLKND